ncbi:MAG: alpha/beta hydrolase [Burkholderiales bacterium]
MLGALVLIGALALAVPLAAYFFQEKLIFLPRPLVAAEHRAIAARHPEVQDVFLQARDGTRLHAWHLKAPAGAPLVLYFGGNAEEVSWLLDELPRRDTGAAWLLVDYRGYGASGGAPSERALVEDAMLWHDYAAKSGARLYAAGRSLGSGVAVRLAAERPLDGLILITPYDSMVAVGKRHYPFLPVELLLRHRFDSLSLARRVSAPLLCIVATHDQIVPPAHAKRLFDAWAGPKQWFEMEAGHNDVDAHPRYWARMRAFLGGR